MSANTPTTKSNSNAPTEAASDGRVYVEIPKAKPSQRYVAPKNYQRPFFDTITRLAVLSLCASLPLAPAVIIGLILFLPQSHAIGEGFLGLWIVMTVFIEAIALFVAIGVAREALGAFGTDRYSR